MAFRYIYQTVRLAVCSAARHHRSYIPGSLDGVPELSRILHDTLSPVRLLIAPPEPDAQSENDQDDQKVTANGCSQ